MKHTWLLAGFVYMNMTIDFWMQDVYWTQADAIEAYRQQLLPLIGAPITFTTDTLYDGTHRTGVHKNGILYGWILEFPVK